MPAVDLSLPNQWILPLLLMNLKTTHREGCCQNPFWNRPTLTKTVKSLKYPSALENLFSNSNKFTFSVFSGNVLVQISSRIIKYEYVLYEDHGYNKKIVSSIYSTY